MDVALSFLLRAGFCPMYAELRSVASTLRQDATRIA